MNTHSIQGVGETIDEKIRINITAKTERTIEAIVGAGKGGADRDPIKDTLTICLQRGIIVKIVQPEIIVAIKWINIIGGVDRMRTTNENTCESIRNRGQAADLDIKYTIGKSFQATTAAE